MSDRTHVASASHACYPAIPLETVRPYSTTKPKGLASYAPRRRTQMTVERILDLYRRMDASDALPLGPRTVGYRLKELYVGEYGKADFPTIGEIVKRLCQSGDLPWSWVADASSMSHIAGGWDSPEGFLRDAHTMYRRDRRADQPVVVEVVAEARETLSLIRRLGEERGVTVYSGGGSCGPGLARHVAGRALDRAVHNGQSTLILGICDFDQAGIRNVLRPHIEHISAFLYGTAGNEQVLAQRVDRDLYAIADTSATVSFHHLALTPEAALGLVETEQDRDRISAYIESGTDVWNRDLDLLDGVQKVETEAFDPVVLRDLVVDAIDDVIDVDTLTRITDEEEDEQADLELRLWRDCRDCGGRPMSIVGIDPSLASTGAASAKGVSRIVPAKSLTGLLRLRHIVNAIQDFAFQAGATVAVIEGPSYGSVGRGQHERGGLYWMVLDRLDRAGISIAVAPPAVVKKYATGRGNASKDEVLAAAVRRAPSVQITGNDEADAWWLYALGENLCGIPIVSLPAKQQEAMRKVEWPGVAQ